MAKNVTLLTNFVKTLTNTRKYRIITNDVSRFTGETTFNSAGNAVVPQVDTDPHRMRLTAAMAHFAGMTVKELRKASQAEINRFVTKTYGLRKDSVEGVLAYYNFTGRQHAANLITSRYL
jgi:5'(3')-deoxyribonucleotidase